MDFIKDFKVTKEENSQIKIEGEIPFVELEKERTKAISHLGINIKLDGFRKGHIPEKVLVEKIDEMAILTEMSERALARVYPNALKEHNIEAIGHPQIQITKIAQNNPLGFTATVAVLPEIKLPDYKKIATEVNQKKESTEVTDEEIETQAKDILRQKIAYERLQSKAKSQKYGETNTDFKGTTELPTPETVSEKSAKDDTHTDRTVNAEPTHNNSNEIKAVTDDEIPELTDELVKTLGQPGQFTTVKDFKAKLREHIGIEKNREVLTAHRAKITDKIIDDSTMELPQILIDSELNQMFAQMGEDLQRANLKMDDYLSHIKKSKEDLQKEWTPAAQKRAELQLILNEIAKQENITGDKGEIDAQVDKLLEQYKDADEVRVRVYVNSVMTNEAVMKMLESQS